jgi:putative protease
MNGEDIGTVSTYFGNANVAAIILTGNLKVGNKIRIKGTTTNFEMEVESMQVEGEDIERANPGDHIGIRVPERVRPKDKVYLI